MFPLRVSKIGYHLTTLSQM